MRFFKSVTLPLAQSAHREKNCAKKGKMALIHKNSKNEEQQK